MKKPELLAPAGNMESLKAAICAGCDAVYLGGYMFGARSFASNFSETELKEAILYAHLYGVKVYVTVNTLVYEEEVETFINYIDYLYKINADAVIIQDIGMLDLVRQTYPLLEVHASTQMHLHNLEGVQFVEQLGVKRAVLARETEISLINEIKKNTNLELEVFVHGALCISYSGQCLMSSLIGGRSGNRGSCAGSCRQKYDLMGEVNGKLKKVNQEEYLLSTKDLNTLKQLGQLMEIGVDSFKIEGRMKRPEYVYIVVQLYRKAIDQYYQKKKIEITEKEILELKKIFNRGFTQGFLFQKEDIVNSKRPNHIGIEIGKVIDYRKGFATIKLHSSLQNGDGIRIIGKNDSGMIVTKIIKNKKQVKYVNEGLIEIPYKGKISKNDIVLKTTDKAQLDQIKLELRQNQRKVPIFLWLELKTGHPPILQLKDGKNEVTVTSSFLVEKAKTSETTKDRIQLQITKCKDSIYVVSKCEIRMDSEIFIPIKELNELRRKAIQALNKKRCYQYPYLKETYHRTVPNFQTEKTKSVLVSTKEQYDAVKSETWKYIYVENEILYDQIKQDSKVILKTSRVFPHIPLKKHLTLVGELGSFSIFPHVITDWSFNVVNSYSVALLFFYHSTQVTLSYELDQKQIKSLIDAYKKRYHAHPNLELIIYGKEEVMISKYRLLEAYQLKKGYLKDRFSNLYPIEENKALMKIYNYRPRKLENPNFYYSLGINSLRYQFLEETKEQIKRVMKNELIRKD